MYEFEKTKRIGYPTEEGIFVFIPKCQNCGRFVKPDNGILISGLGELINISNATCKKCGRIKMIFEGIF